MDIRPIKTETDYHSALRQIDRLWGAELDALEGDKLEALVALVEAYEKKPHPIPLPDPIDAIEYCIERRSLTRHDFRIQQARSMRSVSNHDSLSSARALYPRFQRRAVSLS